MLERRAGLSLTTSLVTVTMNRGGTLVCNADQRADASPIAHAGLPFANPMREAAIDAAIAAMPLPSGPSAVETRWVGERS